jgi:phosphoribosyl-AMP cyclohydrolase
MKLRAEVRKILNVRGGLIPAIAQDNKSGNVLMLAWMNEEALERTIQTGKATYWSRSRNELWEKGATSGNTQEVTEISIDCDGDSVLLKVNQLGPACHTGKDSCFHNSVNLDAK